MAAPVSPLQERAEDLHSPPPIHEDGRQGADGDGHPVGNAHRAGRSEGHSRSPPAQCDGILEKAAGVVERGDEDAAAHRGEDGHGAADDGAQHERPEEPDGPRNAPTMMRSFASPPPMPPMARSRWRRRPRMPAPTPAPPTRRGRAAQRAEESRDREPVRDARERRSVVDAAEEQEERRKAMGGMSALTWCGKSADLVIMPGSQRSRRRIEPGLERATNGVRQRYHHQLGHHEPIFDHAWRRTRHQQDF
jgi:hypothetical protein